MNHITLLGRLTAQPELKQTQAGIAVSTFTVAVRRQSKEEATDFIPCVAWRNTAEFISKYFVKGQMVAVEGSLQTRSYTDKSGVKKTVYEVVISNTHFCGEKVQPKEPKQPTYSQPQPQFEEIKGDEDLPF